jgi:hypothetical protein
MQIYIAKRTPKTKKKNHDPATNCDSQGKKSIIKNWEGIILHHKKIGNLLQEPCGKSGLIM